jgi:hypothetical protein
MGAQEASLIALPVGQAPRAGCSTDYFRHKCVTVINPLASL